MIKEINYFTKDESLKLIDSLSNTKHKLAFLFMLDCGLRVSECISLKYESIDFKNRSLVVESLKKRDKPESRKIPISDRLYECLSTYISEVGKVEKSDWIFQSHDKTKHITRKALNRVCERLKSKNTTFKKLHPHALRHTCATQLLSSGANLVEIKEILGHKKYDTTLIYTHIPQEVLRTRIDTMTAKTQTIWDKLKLFLFPAKNISLINISNNTGDFIIGREKELFQTTDLLNKNCNVILIGKIGTGKTHLLNHIQPQRKMLVFDDFNDIKKTLANALYYLYDGDKEVLFNLLSPEMVLKDYCLHIQKDSIPNLCKQLIKATSKHEYILKIDNVDKITPKGIKVLEMLKDHFTILTSAREVAVNKSSFLWNFEIIRLENFQRSTSLELIQKLSYDLEIEDKELFRNHIFEQTNGNPRAIFEIVERYRKEPLITAETVRNIRHVGSLEEYDMSFIVMLLLSGMAILRYLSGEIGNESLKFFGGIAMIILIFSRYLFGKTKRRFI